MKRVLAISFVALLISATISNATSVTFSAASARRVLDASGAFLANGDLVLVGTLTNESGYTFDPTKSMAFNISQFQSLDGWKSFSYDASATALNPGASLNSGATSSVTTGGIGGARITGTITDQNAGATKATFFNTKLLYVWVFNVASNADPLTATQMGIFHATGTPNPLWQFPTNDDPAHLSDSTTLNQDTTNVPTMAAIGGAGTVLSGGSGNLQLVAPEPSTLAALIGGAGLLAMVRRRAKK